MSKTYYVDSENVGENWIDLLNEEEESDFLIFYTSHSPRIDYEHAINLMNAKKKPEALTQSMQAAPATAPTKGKKQREKRIFFSLQSTFGIGILEYIENAMMSEDRIIYSLVSIRFP